MPVGGDVGGQRGETTGTAAVTVEFDTTKPNIARVYDALLGGKDNYAADRELAERIVALNPGLPGLVRDNRMFITKAVTMAASHRGIRQLSTSALACRRIRRSMRQRRGSARMREWLTWTMTRWCRAMSGRC